MIEEVLPTHARLMKINSDLLGEIRYLRGELRRAGTDAVTGLDGRALFERALLTEHARCRRYGRALGVIMMDLDHFKRVNDRHGHAVGDAVLKRVGAVARFHIREVDMIARYGGEEFVAIIDGVSVRRTAELAERIRASVEAIDEPGIPRVTMSLGVATLSADDADPWDAVKRADDALYAAKANGRNQVGTTYVGERG